MHSLFTSLSVALLSVALLAGCSHHGTDASVPPPAALNPTGTTNDNVAATEKSAPLRPSQAAIASAHALSTQAGMEVLAQGGNAFDAAIAVAASLGVVEPYSAGIGGGGFWLLYLAEQDEYKFIDAREMAPAAAHKDYFLNPDGSVNRDRAVNGPTAAGIPGQAAAFVHLAEHYGQLPLTTSLQAAIDQAKNGFEVDAHYQKLMGFRLQAVRRYEESANLFLQDNDIPEVGYRIRQPDLANTLTALALRGFDGFYKGPVAEKMVVSVKEHGGDWTLQDLANYHVVEREPIDLSVAGKRLISAPPPSSGGIALAQMLKMLHLANPNWAQLPTVEQTHLLAEVMRRAYKDRAEHLGDPDFYPVPVEQLLSDQRAQDWVASIDMDRATPSLSLKGNKNLHEGFHTTHLSVLDQYGNRVSATLSINLPFGSAFTAEGTRILLNNEMDDFSAKPDAPNAYGLVGNEANAIAPGKRPLSSMTPSMLESDGQIAIWGTPGGSRIITMVFLGLLEHLQDKPVADWVSRPRFHHQYLPDVIQHEPNTFSAAEMQALEAKGHTLKSVGRQYGNMQAILWDLESNTVTAAADPRGVGTAQTQIPAQTH